MIKKIIFDVNTGADELFDYMLIIDRLKLFRIIRPHLLNARVITFGITLSRLLLNYAPLNEAL